VWRLSHRTMFALIARTQETTMLDGYIAYGAGDFDGQNSGHDYYGVSFVARCGRGAAGERGKGPQEPWTRRWSSSSPVALRRG